MKQITIDYKPRNWAKAFHESKKRWGIIVCHRRAGKTVAAINHLIRACITKPGRYAYIAPTYKQAKRISWDLFKHYLEPLKSIDFNEADLMIKFPNKSQITLHGSENIDSLRGIGLNGVIMDEASQLPPSLFSQVLSKCLADNYGWAIWISTPMGRNHFYETYKNAQNNPDWFVIFQDIEKTLKSETGDVIENLRKAYADDKKLVAQGQMTEQELEQEWNCSFDAGARGSYYSREISKLRADGRLKDVPYDEALQVFTCWDLGLGSALAIGFFQKNGNQIQMIDFWNGNEDDSLIDAIRLVRDKKYLYSTHFAPHDITSREISTGKTRIQQARELGINFSVVPRVSLEDGIQKTKLMMSRLWVDKNNCGDFLDLISLYRREWDSKRNIFNDRPLHDYTSHAADVLRYCALSEDNVLAEGEYISQADFDKYPLYGQFD